MPGFIYKRMRLRVRTGLNQLKAYKSRRANPDSRIIGAKPRRKSLTSVKFQTHFVGASIKKDDVAFLGTDPGNEVTEAGGTRCWCSGSTCQKRRSLPKMEKATRPSIQISHRPSKPRCSSLCARFGNIAEPTPMGHLIALRLLQSCNLLASGFLGQTVGYQPNRSICAA
jgi:hypothetical protein